jgi:hypothetical protein
MQLGGLRTNLNIRINGSQQSEVGLSSQVILESSSVAEESQIATILTLLLEHRYEF